MEIAEPITRQEIDRRNELEAIVEKNLSAFVTVGMALRSIRDERLYRETHDTFEKYVRDRFDIARRTAYQHIEAASIFENVRNCAQIEILPARESHVLPLSKLEETRQIEVWEMIVDTAPDNKVTASHVAKVVADILGEQIRKRAKSEQDKTRQSKTMPDYLKDLVWQLIEHVREARSNRISKAVRNELRARLHGLINLLED